MELPSGEVKAIARRNELVNDLLITNTEETEMKKLNTSLLALALLTVGFTAAANGVNQKMPRRDLIVTGVQTCALPISNETVKKLANSAPKIEDGKRYIVKVTVMEVPEFKPMNTMPTPEPIGAPTAK